MNLALSPRENQVMRLIAAGHSSEVIAERLGITRATVRSHRTRIYAKLGVSNAASAVAVWLEYKDESEPT